MEITELINQAKQMGITVYHQDGQIQVNIPWTVNRIPDPAKAALGALRERKPEVLAYFALTEPEVNIKLIISALEVQGVKVTSDSNSGFRFWVNPSYPSRCKDTAVKLLSRLDSHNAISKLIDHLSQQAPPPG